MAKHASWKRGKFTIATSEGEETVSGLVCLPLWAIRRQGNGRRWEITHLLTGYRVPQLEFATSAAAKECCARLSIADGWDTTKASEVQRRVTTAASYEAERRRANLPPAKRKGFNRARWDATVQAAAKAADKR